MEYSSRGLRQCKNTGDKWEATFSYKDPLTDNLKRISRTITAKGEDDAKKKRDKLLRDLNKGGSVNASKITVSEQVRALIKHKVQTGKIEDSTAYYYEKDACVIDRYIGTMPITSVGIPQVDQWIDDMKSDGLAPRSIAKPFRLLSQAMKFAIAEDLIVKNPCEFCSPPKIERKEVNALSRAERTRMLKIVSGNLSVPIHCAVALGLLCGLRREEVCGLRFSDLNRDGTLTIKRAIGLRKGGCYVKEPKTKQSRRTIPLDPVLYEYFNDLYNSLNKTVQDLGSSIGDPYILGTHEPNSQPYQPSRLTRDFSTFTKTHGFDCVFHDLRHSFASMTIAAGVDVRTVAALLGHSNVAQTLNTYAEADPDAKRAALGKIQGAFDFSLTEVRSKPPSDTNTEPATEPAISFTVEQLEAMLKEAKKKEAEQN